jgi:dethiobiotin synthetase/adenosylmethionine--8-amino-7-oxononanoate aminotransferase
MRLPVVLVGDHRLGGISSTISAAESLIMRGYDIDTVVCFDDKNKYENAAYLEDYFAKMGIHTSVLPWIPDLDGANSKEEAELMYRYYQQLSRRHQLYDVAARIEDRHTKRLESLDTMASRSRDTIWHPFTQHKHLQKDDDILVIDSALGDYFQAKHTTASLQDVEQKNEIPLLYPAFDGSASWWTQVSFSYQISSLGVTPNLVGSWAWEPTACSSGGLRGRPIWPRHVCGCNTRARAHLG